MGLLLQHLRLKVTEDKDASEPKGPGGVSLNTS